MCWEDFEIIIFGYSIYNYRFTIIYTLNSMSICFKDWSWIWSCLCVLFQLREKSVSTCHFETKNRATEEAIRIIKNCEKIFETIASSQGFFQSVDVFFWVFWDGMKPLKLHSNSSVWWARKHGFVRLTNTLYRFNSNSWSMICKM